VERIVERGIKRVVIGTSDPNPLVNGRGVKFLRDNDIEVKVGVFAEACIELNRAFFKYVKTGQPFVTLKIAQTLDGKIAASNGKPEWITSESSRKLVHKMRAEHDAVLVGIGTVLRDDPQLTVRYVRGENPKRIVLDSKLRIPLQSKLLADDFVSKTIVVTTEQASKRKAKQLESTGAAVWFLKSRDGQVDIAALLRKMGREGIASVLVEGGSQIYSSFLKANLVDQVAIFIAPKILGKGVSAIQDLGISSVANSLLLRDFQKKRVGPDILLTGNLLLI
jgi:diaminohydroxyphosphoribosylaminopyrimidine deaminase/5-amino-6-(5-phosphoribosylamino)uracil reductase